MQLLPGNNALFLARQSKKWQIDKNYPSSNEATGLLKLAAVWLASKLLSLPQAGHHQQTSCRGRGRLWFLGQTMVLGCPGVTAPFQAGVEPRVPRVLSQSPVSPILWDQPCLLRGSVQSPVRGQEMLGCCESPPRAAESPRELSESFLHPSADTHSAWLPEATSCHPCSDALWSLSTSNKRYKRRAGRCPLCLERVWITTP